MFVFTTFAAILASLLAGFAAFVFWKQRSNLLGRCLFFHMLADVWWIGGNAMADIAKTPTALIFWSGIASIGAYWFISTYLIFIDVFIYQTLPTFRRRCLYLLPSLILTPLAFSRWTTAETYFLPDAPAQILPGPTYYVYLVFLVVGLVYGSIRLGRAYRASSILKQKQSLVMQLGFIVLFVGCGAFSVVLPLVGELRFYTLGTTFSLVFIVLSSYAIFRHQLLDIRIVIQRGVIYTLLISTVVLVYVAALGILQSFFHTLEDELYAISSIATSLFGIFTVPPLERFFRKKTDRYFFKDHYDFAQTIHDLSKILNNNMDARHLIEQSLRFLEARLHIQSIYFFTPKLRTRFNRQEMRFQAIGQNVSQALLDEVGKLRAVITIPDLLRQLTKQGAPELTFELRSLLAEYQIALYLPLVVDDDVTGILAVSQKLSGDPYTVTDLRLLNTYAYQAAVALQKASLYEQVRDYTLNLEEKVKQQTAEVRHLQEQQGRSMLDVAHGLLTPITVLKSEVEALRRAAPDSHAFDGFDRSIDRVTVFIRSLLRLAKLETTVQEQPTLIDMSGLMLGLVEYFYVIAEQSQIRVLAQIEPSIFLLGQRTELEELVTNLVSNSMKCIANQREIAIRLKRDAETIRLEIEDSGIGIRPEDVACVFERFRQINDPRLPAQTGNGLGLAISKKIVERHGGEIDITSDYGKRTVVTVRFPNPS